MKRKPDYWYIQSSVIPFRIKNGNLGLCIISSRKKKKWLFPKGIVESGLSTGESALKEAIEEAGVYGILLKPSVGKYIYSKWGGECQVEVYGLRVTKVLKTWEEDFRSRKWIDVKDLKKYILKDDLIQIVNNLIKFL